MDVDALPILGVCGASGSGKTTLIEQLVCRMLGHGLKVVVAKQSPKIRFSEPAGKDSERFFSTGADCLMRGAASSLLRRHRSDATEFRYDLVRLARDYDLVLVEGYRYTPLPKVWLAQENDAPPTGEGGILAALPSGVSRLPAMEVVADEYLYQQWLKPKVLGCILIGGKSSRMGQPKHLLIREGKSWMARTAETLSQVCDQVVVVGAGDLGDYPIPRLLDAPGVSGPLAGILAAMRWHPWSTLLTCACDLPDLSVAALRWLLDQRAPGARAVIPKVGDYHEPLLALYDFRIGSTLEKMALDETTKVSRLVGEEGVRVVTPPLELQSAWRNVNFPEQIEA